MKAIKQRNKLAIKGYFLFAYPKTVFAIIFFIIALNLFLQWSFSWNPYYMPSVLAFCVLALFLPLGANFLYKLILSLCSVLNTTLGISENFAQEWFDKQFDFIFNSSALYFVAILMAMGGIITTEIVRIPWTGFIKFLYMLFTFILFGLMGSIGWVFWSSLVFLYRLSHLETEIPLFSEQKANIDKLNNIFFQAFLIGVVIYINSVIGVWLSPGGEWLTLNYPLIQIWIFPVAGVVTSYFLLIQYFLHNLMKNLRDKKIVQMSELANSYFSEWKRKPSQERAETIDNVLKWKEIIEKQSVWAVDFKSVLSVIVGVFLPAIKTIIDLVVR